MSNPANFKLYTQRATETTLRASYWRLRYEGHVTGDWMLSVDHDNQTETDRFDRMPTTVYILVTYKGRLIAGTRIMPTITDQGAPDYEFNEPVWDSTFNGEPRPWGKTIWSGGRWVNRDIGKPVGWVANGLMLIGMYEAAQTYGITTYLGFPSPRVVEFSRRFGSPQQLSSRIVATGGDERKMPFCVSPVHDSMYRMGKDSLERGLRELETVSPA